MLPPGRMKLLVGCMTAQASRFGPPPSGSPQAPKMRGACICRPDWLPKAKPGLRVDDGESASALSHGGALSWRRRSCQVLQRGFDQPLRARPVAERVREQDGELREEQRFA